MPFQIRDRITENFARKCRNFQGLKIKKPAFNFDFRMQAAHRFDLLRNNQGRYESLRRIA